MNSWWRLMQAALILTNLIGNSTANDPQPQMIARPQMNLDRK